MLGEEREGEEEERLEASVIGRNRGGEIAGPQANVIGRNRGGEIGGPPLNVNVEKSQTV